MLLTDTKLDETVKTAEFLPKTYYRVARKDMTFWGGGVMIPLESQYVADEIVLKLDGEIVWAKIALTNNYPMYIGIFYNNDGSSDNFDILEKSLDEINTITQNNPRVFVAICRNFNALGVDWDSCLITPEWQNIEACEKFVDTFVYIQYIFCIYLDRNCIRFKFKIAMGCWIRGFQTE